MMTILSRRSTGTPCGAMISVPRIVHIPRLVAKITMGARLLSSARFQIGEAFNVQHVNLTVHGGHSEQAGMRRYAIGN